MKRARRMLDGLEDEIRDFIDRETAENIARGMAPEEARRAASVKFGNIAGVREEARAVWNPVWLEQLGQDIAYGLRALRANPGFASIVVLTLGIGIAMSTAAFSVVETVLLRPLSYPQPERLVALGQYDSRIHRDTAFLPDFPLWRQLARSYTAMGAYSYDQTAILRPEGALQATGIAIAGDFWKIVGARPALGRLFTPEEHDAIVLTWNLFQSGFGRDARIIGGPVTVDGRLFTITGVLGKDFRFQSPVWWQPGQADPVGYIAPIPTKDLTGGRTGLVLASLKAGVQIANATTELRNIGKHIADEHLGPMQVPRTWETLEVAPLQEKLVAAVRPAVLILLGSGVFVLLIGSVNIANLQLARATSRRREIAIRAALGAGRLRLMRQFLVESALLAAAGCAAGLAGARMSIRVLVAVAANAVPRISEVSIDGAVLGFAISAAVIACVLFGAASAAVLLRTDLNPSLKEMDTWSGAAGLTVRRLLVAAELGLAIVLLSGAGLMLKSFWQMLDYPAGFNPNRVLLMKVRLSGPQYAGLPAQLKYASELLRRLAAIPGVQDVGLSDRVIFSGAPAFPTDRDLRQTHVVNLNFSSPGYPLAMGMRLVRGRWLADSDGPNVALINESMAREAFGSEDPIGRSISVPRKITVVGVVADLKYSKLDAAPPPEVFPPYRSFPAPFFGGADVALRTAVDATAMAARIRQTASAIDSAQPVYDVKTLEDALADSVAPRRFNLLLLGTFAVCALVLALVGIYGVLAYSVERRTREIGVRVALGARRIEVIRTVVVEGMSIAMAGLTIGMAAALGLTRLMQSMLYEVKANDPGTLIAAASVLAVAAFVACCGPAIRAARLDPVSALRCE